MIISRVAEDNSSLYKELKISMFLEISKKLSTKPSDKILVIDILKIIKYFLIFFIVFSSIKVPGHGHGLPMDDMI